MKKLALPILVFALLGIASLFIPGPTGTLFGIYREFDGVRLTLLVFSFVGAGVAAALALRATKPWHGYVALGGFALAFVKARAWDVLANFGASQTSLKVLAIAITAGLMFALLATVLGDDDATS